MILQENNKQFAVICFARFMSIAQTVDAFYEKFTDDLSRPQPMQQNQNPEEYERQVEKHIRATRESLYLRFRRH